MTPGAAPEGPAVAAVVDVGSNSALLLTVELDVQGGMHRRDEALVTTRLGAGLVEAAALDPPARVRTREAVVALAERARAADASHLWAFGTAAMRTATDGAAFARELAAAIQAPVEVLSGELEAHCAYRAVAAARRRAEPLLVVDAGGRSTELTLGSGETILASMSLPLGALGLTETHARRADTRARLAETVDAALASSTLPGRARELGARLVASGGSATALAAVALDLPRYDGRRVHGLMLDAAALEDLATRPGMALEPGRAVILPAGAAILARTAVACGAAALEVSDAGVRHGYLAGRLAALGITVRIRDLWE